MEKSPNLNNSKTKYNGEPLRGDSINSERKTESKTDSPFFNNKNNDHDFLADALDSLIPLEELNGISYFIVPNLKILHKMAVLALRIMNLIFNSSQATSEKETLLTLLYGKKEMSGINKTSSNETDVHENFSQLVSLFLKLWFGHFNKKAFNNADPSSTYNINQIKKKDVFLSYSDVFEIFNKYPVYDDLLLLPTPLLYNQFLFFFHNNKLIVEANLEMELRANHINNDVNGNSSNVNGNDNSINNDFFTTINNSSVNNTTAFELFMKNMNLQKDADFSVNFPEFSNNDNTSLLEEELFESESYSAHNYINTVLSIPFKVQYHMFQLLQKINFCMFMLISLRLTPHDLTVVDKFAMEAMNGNIQPIRNSKKFKPNNNLTASQLQLQNLNKCNSNEDYYSGKGTFRFFELDTKKLIESSGLINSATAKLISDRAIISDGDSYQIFMDEYQSRLYNSMYDGNSVRSIKKLMKGHINILVEFKTQVFIYELEKYNLFKFHNFESDLSNNTNEETEILNGVFDIDKVVSVIKYLKKTQDRNVINGTEQTLIDKLKIRKSNIGKKICLNDDFSKLVNIQDLIKHYEWFDFVVLFVQFLQKKFFQMNLPNTHTASSSASRLNPNLSSAINKKNKEVEANSLVNLFNTNQSSASTIFYSNSNTNSVVTTPMEYFSEPSTPQCNTHYSGSANSSVGPPSVRVSYSGTGATTPLYKDFNGQISQQNGYVHSPQNSVSTHLMSPAIFLTTNDTTTPSRQDIIATEKESPLISMANGITANVKRKVSRNLWTKEEENALIQGLKICGPSWSQILELYGTGGSVSEALKNRKDLQLKDKARNWKVWLYSSDIRTIPPYFHKVTGGVERSVTGGYKIKRLMFLNNNNNNNTQQTPCKATAKSESVPATPKAPTPGKRKNYKSISLKLEKFLYKQEDLALAQQIQNKYGTNFIISEDVDIETFNSELIKEIEELKIR
ncbi:hypothetical protein HANVADRAFT_61447 [Hanseniaspora valbyensis NRRL Y-1626]|uniref:Uncharacterized protein n=1 Tax=Hanseniaspora valbyensis NRRL Y-1626 TaxID=766949 RepID=A0A1B7TH64_9ASCO|nr:hypothetical protein HANVADRAFT_61447 [Hanseniaspora valbyensis NRRL Y-1626]